MFRFDIAPSGRRILALSLLVGLASVVIPPADAEAQAMNNMQGMGKTQQANAVSGTGTITALNAANRKVTLNHAPIAAINWPAMKMEFPAAASVDLSKLKVGDKVSFTLSGSGSSYTVQSISAAR